MPVYESYLPIQTELHNDGEIHFRDEQEKAISQTFKAFNNFTPSKSRLNSKYLWNAKMRFGKTLCALELAKRLKAKRILIVTHRPVLKKSWLDDFKKIYKGDLASHFRYGTKFEKESEGSDFYQLENLANQPESGYVFFASMQYLRRSNLVGGDNDEKLKKDILNIKWDLVIVDEAHEGTMTERGQNVINFLNKEGARILHLSGTPFNLYDTFKDSEIFTWDYINEQTAKANWKSLDPNPYAELPRMNIFTYDLGKLVGKEFLDGQSSFSFHEFFRTWNANPKANGRDSEGNYRAIPEGAKAGDFIYEDKVLEFLELMCKLDDSSNYPFSKKEYRQNFNHTLWVVPGVEAAAALEKLLNSHPIFKRFKVVNVAGNGSQDEGKFDALKKLEDAIGEDSYNTRTITISCGRLTTGVTVKPWTAVFYLKGSENTSTATYMQTIFRVQSPHVDKIHKRMKTECYVFDFAPDRTLRAVAETAKFSRLTQKQKENASSTTRDEDIKMMDDFIKFCPIVALDGGKMVEFDAHKLFKQLNRVYIQRVVDSGFRDNILYDTAYLANAPEDVLDALDKAAESAGKVPGYKGPDKTDHSITVSNSGGLSTTHRGKKNEDDPESQLSPEQLAALAAEKEEKKRIKKQIEDRREILRAIGVRLPLLIYGGDFADEHGDISLNNFTRKIDDNSWEEFMPRGFSKDDFNKLKQGFNPVIFSESGKLYRQMAREADQMHVEDRIRRIAEIFGRFHNPDKETVLTPWRVVNMHMSDTLGGWCFFNERFDGPCETIDYDSPESLFDVVATEQPRFVDRGEVTKQVFNQRDLGGYLCSKILEINSKTGLYPLYVAYSLYRNRIPDYRRNNLIPESTQLSVDDEQVIWDDVLKENVYVMCNTRMAELITRRTLCGFREVENIHVKNGEEPRIDEEGKEVKDDKGFVIRDTLVRRIKENSENVIDQFQSVGYWNGTTKKENMTFDAIIGNPPYMEMDGGAGVSAKPVYNLFVDMAKAIKPNYISMIMPAKWFSDGKGLGSFRTNMFADRRLSHIFDFVDSRDCFSNVDIAGGVCYFLWDSNADGNCQFTTLHRGVRTISSRDLSDMDEFIRHSEAVNIVDSVKAKSDKFFDKIVSTQKPFGLRTYVVPLSSGDIVLRYNRGKGPYKSEMIEVGKSMIPQWKVIISCLTAEHAGQTDKEGRKKILSSLDVLMPKEICTETYMVVGSYDTEEEAINLTSYLRSRFTRFLIAQLAATQHLSKEKFALVPNQNFTGSSDIDWSKSVEEIDAQLYAKYNLSPDEIAFIESMIKPME